MRISLAIPFLLFHATQYVVAEDALAALASLPQCGLTCLLSAIETSSCATTNTSCICADQTLQVNVTACVEASCTIKQSLVVKNTTNTLCDVPIRNKGGMYNAISTTFGVISGAAVIMRVGSKFLANAQWGWDDAWVCLTLASGIPSTILVVHGITSNGLGRDIWTLTPKQITDFLHNFYGMEALYFFQVAALKLALLFFYKRIFPAKGVTRVINATIIFTICFGIAFILVGLFQCRPIDFYWKRWDDEHVGTCIDINVFAWSNAAISIVLDGFMLTIPISQLIGLRLHWKKKVGVMMMFMVGTFITVISIVRLQSLIHFANSNNATWDNLSVGIWSSVEINVGIICVCMPNLRLLLIKAFPTVFASTLHTKNQYYISSNVEQNRGNIRISRKIENSNSGSSSRLKDEGVIMYSREYTVQSEERDIYREQDDAELIEMKGIGPRGRRA